MCIKSIVGRAPCYPVCNLLPAFVNPVFRSLPRAVVVPLSCPPGGDTTDNTKIQNKIRQNKKHQDQAAKTLKTHKTSFLRIRQKTKETKSHDNKPQQSAVRVA